MRASSPEPARLKRRPSQTIHCSAFCSFDRLSPSGHLFPAFGLLVILFDNPGRRANRHAIIGQVSGDNRVGADDAMPADLNPRHDTRVLSNPRVLPDRNLADAPDSLKHNRGIDILEAVTMI